MNNLKETLRKLSWTSVMLSIVGLPLGTYTRRSRLSWASLLLYGIGGGIQYLNGAYGFDYYATPLLGIVLPAAAPLSLVAAIVLAIVTWKERRSKEVLLLAVLVLVDGVLFSQAKEKGIRRMAVNASYTMSAAVGTHPLTLTSQ
jgi:hypothetical protein